MKRGQTTTETILLLPFYLMLIFGVLQLGQLAIALMVAHYAASSIARQMVQRNTTSTAEFEPKFQGLLTVGMKKRGSALRAEVVDQDGPLRNIKVHACAQISAYPFVGELILRPALGTRYAGAGCGGGLSLGPFYFNGVPPYAFTVHGSATARMNYQP